MHNAKEFATSLDGYSLSHGGDHLPYPSGIRWFSPLEDLNKLAVNCNSLKASIGVMVCDSHGNIFIRFVAFLSTCSINLAKL